MLRVSLAALLPLVVLFLSGCTTQKTAAGLKPYDPFEKINRRVFAFNAAFDRALSRPVSRTYRQVTPRLVKTGIANFVSNLGYPAVIVNDALQGKGMPALRDTGRFCVNTTVGLLGFLDPAAALGLEENHEDLGQTLGRWGVGPGPYLVLPFAGSTTLRDGVSRVADVGTSPLAYVDSAAVSSGVKGLRLMNSGAGDDPEGEGMERIAYDSYLVTRSVYLQRRVYLAHDGLVPEDAIDREYEMYAEEDPIDATSLRQASIDLSGHPPPTLELFPRADRARLGTD